MKNFALIGVGGYIAPRHLEAIHELGHNLIAALDPNDSVGILDRYFPDCQFFRDPNQFHKFLEDQKQQGKGIDYLSICSPNYLHLEHIRLGLKLGANCICEKPLVLNTKDVLELQTLERETGKKVFTILQLRVHDSIQKLKMSLKKSPHEKHLIELVYMTSRGPWYHESWKGDVQKSGGLSTNIGIHFFDMLIWIFGEFQKVSVEKKSSTEEKGTLELKYANVNWYLTIDKKNLPSEAIKSGKTTYRSIQIDGQEFEFSDGFNELHKQVFRDILSGGGNGLEEALPAIRVVEKIREYKV